MAQEEKYGTRDLAYSAYHRRYSMGRYVGLELAQTLSMIDTDVSVWLEYDDRSKEVLALVETAKDVGQANKPSTVTRNAAKRFNPPIEAYVVLYTTGDLPNPADPRALDIISFRVKQIWPKTEEFRIVTPREWALELVQIRERCAQWIDKKVFGKVFYTKPIFDGKQQNLI